MPSIAAVMQEINTKYWRAEQMVVARAAAVCHAKADLQQHVPQPDPVVNKHMSCNLRRAHKGAQALHDFIKFAHTTCGNVARAWFLLDPEEKMHVSERQFMRRCISMGFNGNVSALWHYVDSDRSGFVTLFEIHPSTAIALVDFKKFIDEKFNGSVAQAFQALAEYDGSDRLNKALTIQQLKAHGYRGAAAAVFDMLDRRGLGYVCFREIEFFERWVIRPPFLLCRPDPGALQVLMDAFLEEYGPPLLKVWRKVLDLNRTMRVNWKDFIRGWKDLMRRTAGTEYMARAEADGFPKTEYELACAWRALDTDRSGWISLLEFDPVGHESVAEFRRWTDRVHGGPLEAFRNLVASSSVAGYITVKEANLEGYPLDPHLLFENLDSSGKGGLCQDDFHFLSSWDVDAEDYERKVRFS
jgi:hypothetical protein